jgi:hypothetical protein
VTIGKAEVPVKPWEMTRAFGGGAIFHSGTPLAQVEVIIIWRRVGMHNIFFTRPRRVRQQSLLRTSYGGHDPSGPSWESCLTPGPLGKAVGAATSRAAPDAILDGWTRRWCATANGRNSGHPSKT